MGIALKKLADQIIVVTGASSGIGLCTARLAAKRGARLVLVARNAEALRQLATEIGDSRAIAVPTDVGDENAVNAIVQAAVSRFGGFDTWINDAGIGLYGPMLESTMADNHRLFETNFWGIVYGSLAAARHFRGRNGTGSAIINVGSEVSDRAAPLLGMYSASKHAVKGFTDCLRMELEKANLPISVTLVKPAAIDTPFAQHAKNDMAEEPTLPAPIYAPDVVARAILHCAETPTRDMFAGSSAHLHSIQGALAPRVMDWLMEAMFFDKQKSNRPAQHSTEALYEPTTGLKERSGTRNDARETSVHNWFAEYPVVTRGLVAAGIGLGVLLLAGSMIQRDHR